MVLGFGSKKKKTPADPVFIRASPSLPELAQQRIPWPEDLIDATAVEEYVYSPPSDGHGGARRISFQSNRGNNIPFHKPFRGGDASAPGTPKSTQSGRPPPSAFNAATRTRTGAHPLTHTRSTRRTKNPPTFNVMIVGAKQTGKSSILRLLLDTSAISPANSADQLMSLSTFRSSSGRPTSAISTASVEIIQSPPGRQPNMDDRVTLTCIDTPGLDFSEGKEFALDRAVSNLVQYLDLQFAETLSEESKVVRTSKGDQHVHVCIYLIDPDSVMTPSARRARSRHSHGEALGPSDLPEPSEYDSGSDDEDEEHDGVTSSGDHGDSDDEYGPPEPASAPMAAPAHDDDNTPRNSVEPQTPVKTPDPRVHTQLQTPPHSHTSPRTHNRLTMSPAEIRVIARLAKRVNVLPAVARADTLTDGRLARVKRAIRRDLQAVGGVGEGGEDGWDMGIFAVWDAEPGTLFGRHEGEKEGVGAGGGGGEGGANGGVEGEEERAARPVIKLRERTSARGLTRSRSRKSLKNAVGAEYDSPTDAGAQAQAQAQAQDTGAGSVSRRTSVDSAGGKGAGGGGGGMPTVSYNPMFARAELRARIPFAIIAPEREREKGRSTAGSSQHGHGSGGRFVRRFRWGTVDVLDPQHCDFGALRTAVLGSYMRALKATTKDVLYERYRTEKLLARRATRNITDEDRKRILQDLGL